MSKRSDRRSTSSKDIQGSAEDRRRRKRWLLETFSPVLGPDLAWCELMVDDRCEGFVCFETVTVDRILPGLFGGTYRRDNIQPACSPCNTYHGSLLGQFSRGLEVPDGVVDLAAWREYKSQVPSTPATSQPAPSTSATSSA